MENTDTNKSAGSDADHRIRTRYGGRTWLPLGLVVVGGVLLARQLGLDLPEWLFSWPLILIAIGMIIGLSHGFRGPGWLIMILLGSFFLMDHLIPGLDIHRFLWPAGIIIVGLFMLLRPKKPYWMHDFDSQCMNREQQKWQRRQARRGRRFDPGNTFQSTTGSGSGMGYGSKNFSSEDFIDATTAFGGLHKNILSKNFKGGDIVIFMGGAEINLSQADIQGTVRLDITQILGGTKIIVPSNWEIRTDVTSIFGNIEDKRQNITSTDHDKILLIDGTSIFGGIEIRSY